jgi:hypothetical protein
MTALACNYDEIFFNDLLSTDAPDNIVEIVYRSSKE